MKNFTKISNVLEKYSQKEDKYISKEFQQYGYELASELQDMAHKALYIKLAKETPRELLESAKRFVIDAQNAKSKARLFMWKLKDLKAKSKTSKQTP